jgi:hypothetical protein
MVSVYSKNLQIYNAQQFIASIETYDDPHLYLTFGKISSWANDAAPPQANTSVSTFNDIWKNMVGAKKIQGNDVRLATRRFDWTSNTVYTAYDDCSCSLNMNDPNMKFYVVTDDWNVYKCLSNNNGLASTTKPTSIITTSAIETQDNYVWKYMYTLSDEERMRFTTDQYIPVKTLTLNDGSLQWLVQNTATPGAIESVRITNPGSGYSNTALPTITITGDGTGANATARVNTTTTQIENIVIVNKGSGYTYATIDITSATGANATARAMLSPPGGHGSNPVEELGASFVVMNPRINGTEDNKLDVANEFRQVAIIKDPLLLGSQIIASNIAYSQTTTLYLDGSTSTEYEEDEVVYQGASVSEAVFKGKVSSWDSANNKLELVDVVGNPDSNPLVGEISRATNYILSSPGAIISKAFQPYSGSLIYTNNIEPIQRSADQTEDFKIVISF